MTLLDPNKRGTKGKWKIVKNPGAYPKIVATGLGRFKDEQRTIAIFITDSILSHEDAQLIVDAVTYFRENYKKELINENDVIKTYAKKHNIDEDTAYNRLMLKNEE